MNMQRRLISLVGTLVVIVALVAGTLLMALPVYLESRDIKNEEAQVAASNEVLVARIGALRAKQAEMPQIEEALGDLRSELPHTPQLDDVVKLALRAAGEVKGNVSGVAFGDPAEFRPRAGDDVLVSLPKTATDVETKQEDPDVPTAQDPTVADPDAGGTDSSQVPASASAAQLQVPVSITVSVPTTTAAARFLDGLREGPRLLQVDTVAGVLDEENDAVTLTVNGLVFVQSK